MATKGDISDLDVLMYGGVPLKPLRDSFTRRRTSGVTQSEMEGGLTRQRKKFYNQYCFSNLFVEPKRIPLDVRIFVSFCSF